MKPIIGINCDAEVEDVRRPRLVLNFCYFEAVLEAGGLPLLIPFLESLEDIQEAIARVDGLLLTGGADVDPALYGEQPRPETKMAPQMRQRLDVPLARAVLAAGRPVLGICMGIQVLNVAAGGTLVQDIAAQTPGALQHRRMEEADRAVHKVEIVKGSMLAEIVGGEPLGVNSTHHQAVAQVGRGFAVAARAEDGVIEAIESATGGPALGVQWHPERLRGIPRHRRLFEWLIEKAAASARGCFS